jgi:hypothetical protein
MENRIMKTTLIALGALVSAVALTPAAYAGSNGGGEYGGNNWDISINADTPANFGFADAHGSFTANANATDVSTSGTSSAAAAGAAGGQGTASNNTSAGGTATNGATAGGTSSSSASAGPSTP